MRWARGVGLMVLVSGMAIGCVPPPPVAPAEARRPASGVNLDPSEWSSTPEPGITGAMYDDSGRPLTSATVTLDEQPHEADHFASKSIGSAQAPPMLRPRPVGKRDIFLKDASLDNAFRVLARAGDFNLVVQEGITESVSLELRQVEPYDAALVLAEANHLSMRYHDGIVVVGRPGTE